MCRSLRVVLLFERQALDVHGAIVDSAPMKVVNEKLVAGAVTHVLFQRFIAKPTHHDHGVRPSNCSAHCIC